MPSQITPETRHFLEPPPPDIRTNYESKISLTKNKITWMVTSFHKQSGIRTGFEKKSDSIQTPSFLINFGPKTC